MPFQASDAAFDTGHHLTSKISLKTEEPHQPFLYGLSLSTSSRLFVVPSRKAVPGRDPCQ